MLVNIPNSIVQEALEAHIIQNSGSVNSTEGRAREVERREKHFAEIVIWIIASEYRKQRILPYGNLTQPVVRKENRTQIETTRKSKWWDSKGA